MKTWVTWALLGANIVMFAVELACGADPLLGSSVPMLRLGGNFSPLTLGQHEWWRLLASMFLHAGLIHLGMNMLCLWQARAVERIYGHGTYAVIYFVSGILGGVGSIARGTVMTVGASGAVFGIFGAFAAYLLRVRKTADREAWRNTVQRFGSVIALNLIVGLQVKGIDVTAHFFGLLAGFATGMVAHRLKALPTLVAGLAIAIAALLVLPVPFSLDPVLDHFHVVEHDVIETYNGKLRAQKANGIDRNDLADTIDRELLPKWRTIRAEVDAVDDGKVAPGLRKLLGLYRKYALDREEAWKALAESNRTANVQPELADAYHAKEQLVKDDIQAINEEQRSIAGK